MIDIFTPELRNASSLSLVSSFLKSNSVLLKVVLDGSDGDFQFTQEMTTTCSNAVCHGIIDIDLDSENASVSIKQGN